MGAGEVGGDLAERPLLGGGERERQVLVEVADEPPAAVAGGVLDALRLALDRPLAQHQGELEAQQLVEHQPAPGLVALAQRLGGVDVAERPGAAGEVEAIEDGLGHRLGEVAGPLEHLLHPAGLVPARDAVLLGLRVDRDDAARAVADQVDERVRHLPAALVAVDLAEQDRLRAGRQLPLAPRLVEERDPEVTGAVADVRGDQRLRARPAGAPPRDALHGDEDHRLLADPEVGQARLPGPVDVVARVVGEQVEHRLDAEGLLQRPRVLRPDPLQDRDVQLRELRETSSHAAEVTSTP